MPDEQLWRLDHRRKEANPRLDRVAVEEGGEPFREHDTIDWTEGAMLLATDAGLWMLRFTHRGPR